MIQERIMRGEKETVLLLRQEGPTGDPVMLTEEEKMRMISCQSRVLRPQHPVCDCVCVCGEGRAGGREHAWKWDVLMYYLFHPPSSKKTQ
jgi:hypothetical protein